MTTYGKRIENILGAFADVSARDGIPADIESTAAKICAVFNVSPDTESVAVKV